MTTTHVILPAVRNDPATPDLDPPRWPARLPGQHELPSEDGEPMETERHRVQMSVLIESLELASRGRPDLYVNGNMFVYFSEEQLRSKDFRGPDVFVVLGTTKAERRSWVLWEELRLPDVVIELTSPSTSELDHVEKKRIYADVWRTPVYVIYDPFSHELEGFRLVGGRYEPLVPDATGAIPVDVLGLSLAVRDLPLSEQCGPPGLRWLDSEGTALPLGRELAATEAARAEREAARAEREATRAEREAARADALGAELAALRARGGG